jgi:signal transduction histidine kinase
MRADNTLRRRLTTAFVLLAIVIGAVLAASGYVVIEAMEYQMSDVRLLRAASAFVEDGRPPPSDLVLAVDAQIPSALLGLAVGRYEIELEGRDVHVLLGEHAGRRYAIMDDTTEFERIESIAFAGLGVAFVAGVLLALAIARALAGRVIAPLTTLARAVETDALPAQPQLLAAADEIGVLARAFDAKATQLRDFLVRERLFTADVSHELRTPLTVILGAAEVLAARLADRPDLRAAAERIRRTSAETAVRVSALLQLARSPEKIEDMSLSLRDLVEQEIERCRPLLDGKPVDLRFESRGEVRLNAAPDLAAIAVGNLLRNACNFTERGSVRVALEKDALVIEDTGPGVPAAVRDRLFERFVRGDDDRSAGYGLGLSIVKRVTDHLGWAIRLEDTQHGGSRFTLTFPSSPPELTHS